MGWMISFQPCGRQNCAVQKRNESNGKGVLEKSADGGKKDRQDPGSISRR